MIFLSKKLASIWKIASTDELRPATMGVKIDAHADGTFDAVATNGHLLIHYKNKREPNDILDDKDKSVLSTVFSGIVPIQLLQKITNWKKQYTLHKTSKSWCLRSRELETKEIFLAENIDEAYPRWESVVPTEEPKVIVRFNLDYMREICEVLKPFANKYSNAVDMEIRYDKEPCQINKAIIFHPVNEDYPEQKITTLLMPIRR